MSEASSPQPVRTPKITAILWCAGLLRFVWLPFGLAVLGRWLISYFAIVTSALVAFAAAQAGRAPDGPIVLPGWLQLPPSQTSIPRAMGIAAAIMAAGAVLEILAAWCASWIHAILNRGFTRASIDATLRPSAHADAALDPSTAVQRWLLKLQITDLFHNGLANVLGGLGTLAIVLTATFRLNAAAGWVCVATVVLWTVIACVLGVRAVLASRDAAARHEQVGGLIRATVALRQDLWRPSFRRFWQRRAQPDVAELDRAIIVQGFWGSLLYGCLTGIADIAPLIAVLVAMPSGGVATGVAAYLFVSRLMPPLTTLATMMPLLQEYLVSVQRVYDAFAKTFSQRMEEDVPLAVRGSSLEITAARVPFGAGNGVELAGLTVSQGAIAIVTGPSGSGKSTLLRALCGMEPNSRMTMFMDGMAVDVREDSWREACLLLPQEPALMPGTAAENLFAFPEWTASDELSAIVSVLEESLPNGLSTAVGVDAAGVSVGQRRVLALVRALGCPSSLLLLDEPLAGVDARLAAHVRNALLSAARSRCIVVAAHEHDVARLDLPNANVVRLAAREAEAAATGA